MAANDSPIIGHVQGQRKLAPMGGHCQYELAGCGKAIRRTAGLKLSDEK